MSPHPGIPPALLALLVLLGLPALLLTRTPGEAAGGTRDLPGLLNRQGEPEPLSPRTEQDLAREDARRTPFTPAAARALEGRMASLLSRGEFAALDALLSRTAAACRDGGEEQGMTLSLPALIEPVRRDLALVLREGAPLTGFAHPRVLAAAFLYAPVSAKLDAPVHQDSCLLPPVPQGGGVDLQRLELSSPQLLEAISRIRRRMPEGEAILGLEVFSFRALGRRGTLALICRGDGTWQPYRLEVEGDSFPRETWTVSALKDLREAGSAVPGFSLDSWCARHPPAGEVTPH